MFLTGRLYVVGLYVVGVVAVNGKITAQTTR